MKFISSGKIKKEEVQVLFEYELFSLFIKGVLLTIKFKDALENMYIDLTKIVRIQPNTSDPQWVNVFVIAKRTGLVKVLQFDCGSTQCCNEIKLKIIELHRRSTKCAVISEHYADITHFRYGWGNNPIQCSWKHECYLCARNGETDCRAHPTDWPKNLNH